MVDGTTQQAAGNLPAMSISNSNSSSMMQLMMPIQTAPLRVVKGEDGEPWFVAKDICDALGLGNVSMTCGRLKASQRGIKRIEPLKGGSEQDMVIISLPGLYKIVLRSDKAAAEPFFDWVTEEVLPSLQKHGFYAVRGRQQKATRWGWQPIREVMRQRGFSARDFVQSANALDLWWLPAS